MVASNDDWRDFDGTSTALENRLRNGGLALYNNRESIMVVKLNAGAYTVILSGKNGAAGVGIIEVYEY